MNAPLTLKDLVDQANRTGPIDMEFTPYDRARGYGVDELESYPEAGMRARLNGGYHQADDVTIMEVDFAPFEEHNRPFESVSFYSKGGSGAPLVSARDAGQYKPQTHFYVPSSMPAEALVKSIDIERLALVSEWKATAPEQSYHTFLEQQVIALRSKLKPALSASPAPESRPRRSTP